MDESIFRIVEKSSTSVEVDNILVDMVIFVHTQIVETAGGFVDFIDYTVEKGQFFDEQRVIVSPRGVCVKIQRTLEMIAGRTREIRDCGIDSLAVMFISSETA